MVNDRVAYSLIKQHTYTQCEFKCFGREKKKNGFSFLFRLVLVLFLIICCCCCMLYKTLNICIIFWMVCPPFLLCLALSISLGAIYLLVFIQFSSSFEAALAADFFSFFSLPFVVVLSNSSLSLSFK